MNGNNPFYVQPGGNYGEMLSGLGNTIEQYGKEKKAKQRFDEVRTAMQAAWDSGDSDQIAQLAIDYPESRQVIDVLMGFKNDKTKAQGLTTYRNVLSMQDNPQGALAELDNRIAFVQEHGGNPEHTMQDRDALARAIASGSDTAPIFKRMENAYANIASPQEYQSYKEQRGYGASQGDTAAVANRNDLFKIIQDEKAPDWKRKAARIELGLDPRAVGSSEQTMVESGTVDSVAKAKAAIASAVQQANVQAKDKGETLNDYGRASAAMPGLEQVVANLRELAPVATYSTGGKIFDTAVKELGFGSTEGATSRAKFIAIIDNQILPLLKQTFGAAFTVEEGKALKATMGDPDATPEAKMQQLDAFIQGKYRDLESKERQLGVNKPKLSGQDSKEVSPTGRTATNPKTGQKIQEMSDGSWRPI